MGFFPPWPLFPRPPLFLFATLTFILLSFFIRALFPTGRICRPGATGGPGNFSGFFYMPLSSGSFRPAAKMATGRVSGFSSPWWPSISETPRLFTWAGPGAGENWPPRSAPERPWKGGWGAVAGSLPGPSLFKFSFSPSSPVPCRGSGRRRSGVIGQLGDLWESLLKRSAQVKDSGPSYPDMAACWTASTASSSPAPLCLLLMLWAGMKGIHSEIAETDLLGC